MDLAHTSHCSSIHLQTLQILLHIYIILWCFFVSAVRILLLSNFCKLPLNYMQQEESLDLCSIVRSFFCPIVDFDHNLSSPEVIFIVMIFLPLLFRPIGRVECTLFLIFRKALFSVGTSSFKEARMVSSTHTILKEAFTTLLEELQYIELYPCIRTFLNLTF